MKENLDKAEHLIEDVEGAIKMILEFLSLLSANMDEITENDNIEEIRETSRLLKELIDKNALAFGMMHYWNYTRKRKWMQEGIDKLIQENENGISHRQKGKRDND